MNEKKKDINEILKELGKNEAFKKHAMKTLFGIDEDDCNEEEEEE